MANIRADVTEEQLERGRKSAKERKSFMVFYDALEAWKMLPGEQFKVLILALAEYSQTYEKKTFEDSTLNMAYMFGVAGLERNAEAYAVVCANRSAAKRETDSKKSNSKKKDGNIGALAELSQL